MPYEFPELPTLRGEIITRLSDTDFFALCQANKLLWLERNADQTITVTPPAGCEASGLSGEIHFQLFDWNRQTRGGRVYGSSAGFRLSNGAVRSPDASWISCTRYEAAPPTSGFLTACPELAAENCLSSTQLPMLQAKMQEYLANGVQLGFLLDVEAEAAYVYRPGQPAQTVQGYDQTLSGEPVLPGFALDLRPLRRK